MSECPYCLLSCHKNKGNKCMLAKLEEGMYVAILTVRCIIQTIVNVLKYQTLFSFCSQIKC